MRLIGLLIAMIMGATMVAADQNGLKCLDTGHDSTGWEAVGRLEIGGKGFCTASLIAPDLVLTAAHCLYDDQTGEQLDHSRMEFRLGWRNGWALSYRQIRHAAIHPDYRFDSKEAVDRVRNDLALLQLQHPVRGTSVQPFQTADRVSSNAALRVISYAHDRADAPSLEEECHIRNHARGVIVMSCNADFGASGSPVFAMVAGEPRIVSVISAKAMVDGVPVSIGASLAGQIDKLQARLVAGARSLPKTDRMQHLSSTGTASAGAKFVRP